MDYESHIRFSDDAQKQAIFEAALYEFAESGYNGTTIRQIARRTGIAHGLIYYYFKDKKTLYLELCRLARTIILSALSDPIDSGDVYDVLLAACRKKLDLFARYPTLYKVVMDEVRLFPEAYQADGQELKKNAPIWEHLKKTAHCDETALDILESALSGLTENLLNRFCAGYLSAEEMLTAGMEKARAYIEFFKKISV